MMFSAKPNPSSDAQIAALTKERDDLRASLVEWQEANADCQARFGTDQLLISTLTQERDTFKTENGFLTAKLADAEKEKLTMESGIEARVGGEVIKRLAHAGVDPIKRDPSISPGGPGEAGSKGGGSPRQRLAENINRSIGVL